MPGFALLSEICLIRYRGQLATLNTFNGNFGWLLGLCIGLVVPVQFLVITLSSPSLLFLILCWSVPESPVWLMRRGREEEARQTLTWLRGKKYDLQPELEELRSIIVNEENSSGVSLKDILRTRTFVVPLILSCTLCMFQAMSGTYIISYYNGVIFKDIGLSEEYVAILYQVNQGIRNIFVQINLKS